MVKRLLVLALFAGLLLSGCGGIAFENLTDQLIPTANPLVILVQQPQAPTAEEVIQPEYLDTGVQNVSHADVLPTETPQAPADILQLTFPTPAAEPVSLWRPPLYDTPWALTAHDHFYFSRPIAADEVNWPLADYRYGGVFFDSDIVHTGIDIPAKYGTPVIAAGLGKVIWAGYGLFYGNGSEEDPYGLAVSIEHDFGHKGQKLYTIYAHLSRIDVVVGQGVETGTQLGLVGTTGNTTGPHLHFEVRIEDDSFYKTRNPELWIAPPQGWGVLAGNIRSTSGNTLDHHTVNIRSLRTGQKWQVNTYGPVTVHKDDYYQENMVISDLPAGRYEVTVDYLGKSYSSLIDVEAGAVAYIRFNGEDGFDLSGPESNLEQTWPDESVQEN
jgi:murein DD-endopeptidase MepM/ murein hydrolase activator NlpD